MSVSRTLLLALLALAFAAIAVRADDADVAVDEGDSIPSDEGEDFIGDEALERDPNAIYGVFSRAFFDGQDLISAPRFPAGEKAHALVAFTNDIKNPTYEVFFVSAFITRLGDYFNPLQNFSGVRHERPVAKGETANFRYAFTPDPMLEPLEYNLVVRLFFRNDENQTFAAVAYNSTIVIDEPLGTDPKTIMTFLTIAAIFGAVGYIVNSRRKRSYRPRSKAPADASANVNAYDPEYVSKEHLRFREEKLRKSSASPPKTKQ